MTREQCNYTITGLKAVFPVALAKACPIGRIRNYMQRSLDRVCALLKIGCNGDFALIPSLRKVYNSHRRSELIRLGLASDVQFRHRDSRGSVKRARLKTAAEIEAANGTALEVDETAVLAGGNALIDLFHVLYLFFITAEILSFRRPDGRRGAV